MRTRPSSGVGGTFLKGDAELGRSSLLPPLSLAPHSFLEGNTLLTFNLPNCREVSHSAARFRSGEGREWMVGIYGARPRRMRLRIVKRGMTQMWLDMNRRTVTFGWNDTIQTWQLTSRPLACGKQASLLPPGTTGEGSLGCAR
jgi:hypothetical protein